MPNDLVIGPFTVRTALRDYKIERAPRTLVVSPPGAEDAISLVVDAMKIESFPLLPMQLDRGGFILRFSPDRSMVLSEKDRTESGVPFSFDEGDSLIYCLRSGLDLWISEDKALRGSHFIPASSTADIPFDTGQ